MKQRREQSERYQALNQIHDQTNNPIHEQSEWISKQSEWISEQSERN
jgi:hypothetical protein